MGSLPEFPQENPFENENRFYLVDESELEDNDWIRLYLELSVARSDWTSKDHDLSHLKIVNVAIETMEPPSESSLTAKNATVYIRYIDSCVARCGQKFDRIAVVRRRFNERTGCFILDGWNQSSEIIPEKVHQNQSSEKKSTSLSSKLLSRRLIHKSRRIWRRRCAYINHGIGLADRLRKTRSIESAIRKYTQKVE